MTQLSPLRHLTEAERHDAAQGSLAPDDAPAVAAHLDDCGDCSADVARLRSLMTRAREAEPPAPTDADDLWSQIRTRIEREKVVQLSETRDRPEKLGDARRRVPRPLVWTCVGAVAAAVVVAAVLRNRHVGSALDIPAVPSAAPMSTVAESTTVYEQQARFLLNELELRRALLRPQTAESIDHDLKVIDDAIAEIKLAIERDPNNKALRALLASSYKQKVDLLKRVGNAG